MSTARQLNPIYATTTAVSRQDLERRDAKSYLAEYAVRRPASSRRARRGVRVDEHLVLNRPKFDGGAYVRVFVEDTSRRTRRFRSTPPPPRLRLRVADCAHQVNLEFSVETAELRENALFKTDTLLGALTRFRHGLAAEAELYAKREQQCHQ